MTKDQIALADKYIWNSPKALRNLTILWDVSLGIRLRDLAKKHDVSAPCIRWMYQRCANRINKIFSYTLPECCSARSVRKHGAWFRLRIEELVLVRLKQLESEEVLLRDSRGNEIGTVGSDPVFLHR